MVKTSQAELIYDAQQELDFFLEHGGLVDFYGSKLYVEPCERKFVRVEDVQRFVDTVYATVMPDGRPPRVKTQGNLRRRAYYMPVYHTITLPPHKPGEHSWAFSERVVLHEIAHAMTPGHGHDETFASCMVMLLRRCMTPEIAVVFERSLRDRGVHTFDYVV